MTKKTKFSMFIGLFLIGTLSIYGATISYMNNVQKINDLNQAKNNIEFFKNSGNDLKIVTNMTGINLSSPELQSEISQNIVGDKDKINYATDGKGEYYQVGGVLEKMDSAESLNGYGTIIDKEKYAVKGNFKPVIVSNQSGIIKEGEYLDIKINGFIDLYRGMSFNYNSSTYIITGIKSGGTGNDIRKYKYGITLNKDINITSGIELTINPFNHENSGVAAPPRAGLLTDENGQVMMDGWEKQ